MADQSGESTNMLKSASNAPRTILKRRRRAASASVVASPRKRFSTIDLAIVLLVMLTVVAWIALAGGRFESDWLEMVAASVISVLLTILGIRRSKATLGRLDFFHPLVFPLLYVLISFLAPIWATVVSGYPVGALTRDNALASNTPFLLCLGVAGFAAGAAFAFSPHRRKSIQDIDARGDGLGAVDEVQATQRALGNTMLAFGRILLIATLVLLAYAQYRGGAATRGIDQTDYNLDDSVNVVAKLMPLAGLVLIAAGHGMRRQRKILSAFDVVMMLLVVAGIGLGGSRNGAIAIILMVLFMYSRRAGRVRWSVIVVGFVAVVGFVLVVLNYRNSVRGIVSDKSWWASVLGDMAPAAFSVGVVADSVPSAMPYAHGATVVTAIIRQLPSPISVGLLGDANETGASMFRDIAGVGNANTGVGFSIPAEGYLNFGVFGLVLFCFLMGLVLSWFYARVDLHSGRVTELIYPILVGVLPTALRTDLLGAFKLILYPSLMILAVIVIGRSVALNGAHRRRSFAVARRRRAAFAHAVRGQPDVSSSSVLENRSGGGPTLVGGDLAGTGLRHSTDNGNQRKEYSDRPSGKADYR